MLLRLIVEDVHLPELLRRMQMHVINQHLFGRHRNFVVSSKLPHHRNHDLIFSPITVCQHIVLVMLNISLVRVYIGTDFVELFCVLVKLFVDDELYIQSKHDAVHGLENRCHPKSPPLFWWLYMK